MQLSLQTNWCLNEKAATRAGIIHDFSMIFYLLDQAFIIGLAALDVFLMFFCDSGTDQNWPHSSLP